MDKETRVFTLESLEVREAAEGESGPTIRGYAAVYNQPSEDLGGFVESIRPGAFAQAIGRDDVRALFNHDANYVLGRNRAGTLALHDDARGLGVTITPPPAQWANDLMESMRRGDIDQMSFAFGVTEDTWTRNADGYPHRELVDLRLYDVSVVTYPAYPQTSAAVRSKINELSDQAVGDDNRPAADVAASQGRRAARKRRLLIKKRGF